MRWVAAILALPALGFLVLLLAPEADAHWQHRPTHFWLVLLTAVANVALGLLASEAARRRADARAQLVSLAFLASAGFLGLHALATPGAIVEGSNLGFVVATQIGLVLAAGFAAAAALDLTPSRAEWVQRHERALRVGLLALIGVWAVGTIAGLPPLDREPPADPRAELLAAALVACALYGFATFRFARLWELRGDPLPGALAAAWVLLAEASVAVALSRSWKLTWWEWHLLMAAAFALVAWAARVGYRRGASVTAAFGGVYLDATLERLDGRTADALRRLTGALERDEPLAPVLAALQAEGLNADEVSVLERSARELRRVDALFRPYVSPALAAEVERLPELARLGGTERDVSVLFADLQGFTSFSETRPPGEAIEMLNAYWEATVPRLLEEGATIERFAGDAVMAVFNAVGDQPDHADRAVHAAATLLDVSERLAAQHDGWPRFRAGVATGPAAVGHVGTQEQRSFTAIGDTTNLAARLQALAEPGGAIVAGSTARRLASTDSLVPAGEVSVKGRTETVEVFTLADVASRERPTTED